MSKNLWYNTISYRPSWTLPQPYRKRKKSIEDQLESIENQLSVLSSSCKPSSDMLSYSARAYPSTLENSDIVSDFSDTWIRNGDEIMASKYRERVRIATNPDGTPVYAWACGNTKDELHRSIASILSALLPANQCRANPPLWCDYASDWYLKIHVPQIRAKTTEKEGSLMKNHVIPAFPALTINMIDSKAVQDYLATKSHYSTCQVRDIMGLMRQVFNCAVEDGYIPKNPMDSTRVFNTSTKPEHERKVLSADEQSDIITHLDTLTEPNARRLIALLMFAPLRPCEIYGLRWDDIDPQTMTIHVRRDLVFVKGKAIIDATKTEDSERPIPYDDNLHKYLIPYGTDGFVISMTQRGREGEHLSSDSCLRNLWRRIGKTINLHGMTPYTGRHTFATNMSRAGVPIKAAMSMMGHKDERMLLRRYTHVDQSDLLNANKHVTDYLNNLAPGM